MVDQVRVSATAEKVNARLQRRYAVEKRFRFYGIASIVVALSFLAILLFSIISQGHTAFMQAEMRLSVTFDPSVIDPDGGRQKAVLSSADYTALVRNALLARFPEAEDRLARREMIALISQGADLELRKMVMGDPSLIGTTRDVWLPAAASVDQLRKGHMSRDADKGGQFTQRQLGWIDALESSGNLSSRFNKWLFTSGDSRQPELAGLWGAVVGSFYSLLVTVTLSFPLGVATAIYLEEFSTRNRWTDLIEVNINNLAAVPSIVFGLLGLEIFLNVFNLPRSAPLVGGLALTLVSLPTIIIASRVALKAVPPWIREAALGLGASRLQMVMHHVLPLAMPGILTGTIIGMARAVGESAPLLMIGMVAFIVDVPASPLDPSTALPVQIYLWAASPERAFVERTSAAIIVLLCFLAVMNATAIFLRKKFERRW
ncbi:phosphate ABC transporter, permease protein PstA [Telmatospirillum siberiense]|uniref:Phosphate transport system permease protein PstA n=2 Tax=Telmatospirillum siberiense TaxID=382514 RepID=A0A2N3PNF4_9PROT|nr:phosphate ABC transporter, permease protein PstA [Telmatospirillum siberiense]